MEKAPIDFEVVRRKNGRNIVLRVLEPDGLVRVSAPRRTSQGQIERFVASRAAWIEKQQERIAARPQRMPRNFETGEQLMLWGESLTLRVETKGELDSAMPDDVEPFDLGVYRGIAFVRNGSTLTLREETPNDLDARRAAYESFLEDELKREIDCILPRCEELTKLHCASVRIRKMRSRWGSCTVGTGKIRIALRIVAYPKRCLVMVLVHELTHLLYPDHGPGFKAFMDACLPDWRETRALLR